MNTQTHCPYRQTKNLQDALTSDKVKVAFLLGAGCPVSIRMKDGIFCADETATGTSPLVPDIAGLTGLIKTALKSDARYKDSFTALLNRLDGDTLESKVTIEDILSHIRSLQDVIREGSIDGLNKTNLAALDKTICDITTKKVNISLPQARTAYHQLATWIGGVPRAHAVELFTPNYDLLLEQGLEAGQIPYFDGFVGSKQAFFDLTSMEAEKEKALPDRWARLWKLHGSVNWWRVAVAEKQMGFAGKGKDEFEVVRGEKPENAVQQMIYPSHLKYDQSRRMPYLAMLDRLRSFLGRGQAVLVTCGYSFLDQHLNEVILQGLRSNPTAMCFGLLHDKKSKYPIAVEKAKRHQNLSLLARDGAVLGTFEKDWHSEERDGDSLNGLSVRKSPTGSCEFVLGDFRKLGEFLATQLSRSDDDGGGKDAA
jgi:SIR2-like domain